MCGICGVIGNESTQAGEMIVRRMLAAIVHRGPDEEALLFAQPVAAGARRLSIIDLPGGSQPIWNEDRTLAVLYNGEIYNFRALRLELEASGHRFRTNSDTEVVVHAYEAWGERCVERLQGMFAFAIVEMLGGPNGRATRVFFARDRLGIKPLYYAVREGSFLFASEVRALLASGCVEPRISREAVPAYLLFGSVSEPQTMIEGLSSLPPGHSLMISADAPDSIPAPKQYWSLSSVPAAHEGSPRSPQTIAAAAAQVRSLLEGAVERHLIADVPIGIFLSGGLDSTALAALACQKQHGIRTFTVAFPDEVFSEAGVARRTAARLGSQHSELAISENVMLARLDEAVAAFDEPSMDGINTYFVSWAARQTGLKVALSGLGSDELFGGYTSFRATAPIAGLARTARFVPRPFRVWSAAAIEKSGAFPGSRARFRKGSAAWIDPETLPHPYYFSRALFSPRETASAVGQQPDTWQRSAWWSWLQSAASESSSADAFTAVSWLELRSYLPNVLLRDTDAMSMRHSLEVRVPFLDAPLVEYLLSIPQAAKSDPKRPKALLIEALGALLPQEIVSQRKRTFTFPWENWLRGKLGKRVSDSLADWSPALAPFVRPEFARSVWRDFVAGKTTWSRPWSLFVLNEWVRRNLRAEPASTELRPSTAAVSAA